MQNDNINLRELLKGHENEVFYSPEFGNVTYLGIDITEDKYPLEFEDAQGTIYFMEDGKLLPEGECVLFPSKHQRDWIKWDKEHNPKIPKTWEEISKVGSNIDFDDYSLECFNLRGGSYDGHYSTSKGKDPIEKAALAILKIHQLIEKGYGGNITKDEWKSTCSIYTIEYIPRSERPIQICNYKIYSPIAFHTKEQAEEFLSYSENIQLIKDYYMIKTI